jgi:ParB family chromosome partitioning protein
MKTAIKSKRVDQPKPNMSATSEVIKLIPLECLLPNPYQPATRGEVDPETAKKFALSIQEHGLLQTPVVRPSKEDAKYEIGDGWLRRAGFAYLASNLTDSPYRQMPCVVRNLTDQQMADMVLEANTIRKDLNPIELAKVYKRYLDDFGISQTELARRHNCSQGEIANTMRLLELPADIQQKIISQEISETHGRQLLRLNYNPELQHKELNDAIKEGNSVNELSNSIAQAIYWSSENIDPKDYPAPPFDVTECESCPNRQKIGYPFSSEKKKWRCLDKACYEKKEDKAEEERIAKLTAEIKAAREAAPQQLELKGKGKGKKKKDEVGVIDTSKMTWRDYQRLDGVSHNIDNPGECKTCQNRAIGRFYGDRTDPICINVKCFKEKEKTHQAKEAAKTRQAENDLTEKLKVVCAGELKQAAVLKIVAQHLMTHARKDTLERFGRLYKIDDAFAYFASSSNGDTLQKLAALVLQKERYEGTQGLFVKMMADLEGTGAELDKQIAAFQKKHCKTCHNAVGRCSTLMRVYYKDDCYAYSKKRKEDEEVDDDLDENEGKPSTGSEDQDLKDSLPCKDCANGETCDRSFFYADNKNGYVCDRKKELAEANAT